MAAPPMARPVRLGTDALGPSTSTSPASPVAPPAASDDLFALFSDESSEPVAAAALRAFCAGGAAAPADTQPVKGADRDDRDGSGRSGEDGRGRRGESRSSRRARSTRGDSSPERRQGGSDSKTSSRRSGGGRSQAREASIAGAPSVSPSPSLTFHPSGLLVAPPHSARSTSGGSCSSAGDGTDTGAESASRGSSLSPPPRRSPSSSSSSSSSRSSEGKRAASSSDGNARAARGGDFSAASSESHARMAHVESARVEEARMAPPSRRAAAAPPAARYETFGEWERPGLAGAAPSASASASASPRVQAQLALQQAQHIPRWLALQGFDETVYPKLALALCTPDADNATGGALLTLPLLLRQTKSGLKNLLGVRDGIRLHLALRDLETAQEIVDAAGGGTDAPRAARSAGGGKRPQLSPESVLPTTECGAGAASPWRRDLHPAGVHGYCAVSSCDLPAPAVCASKSCCIPLCTFHAHKMLLTGTVVCERCYEQTTIADNVREAMGINALQEQGYPVDQCVLQ